jgi:hypothetical protein
MVTIKQAATTAHQYLSDLLGLTAAQQMDVRLEETEGNEAEWLITLSIRNPDSQLPSWLGKPSRDYKIISVDKKSGEVTSMRIRTIQNA